MAQTQIQIDARQLACIQNKERMKDIKIEIKKGNITSEDVEWLQKRVWDNRWMQIELISMLDDIKNNPELTPSLKLKLIDTYSNVYKALHGNKVQIDVSGSIDINQHEKLITSDLNVVNAEVIRTTDGTE